MKKTIALILTVVVGLGLIFPISTIFASSETPSNTPFFDSFGTATEFSGQWLVEEVENVGTVFRSTAATAVELNSGIQDFMLDFKVKLPKDTVSPFSVFARVVGQNGYEFTVNKNADGGVTCGILNDEYVADSSINIADGKWHTVSVRMLAERAVILVDGIKVFDDILNTASVSGALKLNVNAIDTYVSGITLAEVTAEDMDTVADYDFSTDTYQNVFKGWNTAFNTDGDVNGIKSVSGSWSPKTTLKSISENESVKKLSKVTDFALSFTTQWNIASNNYQRGLHMLLPNGYYLQLSGSQCRYGTAITNMQQIVNHSAVGSDWHRFDVVLSGTSLKVFIDRKEVYNITVTAAVTPADLVITQHNSATSDTYKFSQLSLKTGAGVHDPEPAPELEMPETMYTHLNNNGWVREGLSVYATNSTIEKPYTGWGCAPASAQNFILDFNLTIGAEEKGSVELRVRHGYTSVCNLGYRFEFFAGKMTVAKYNDNNFQNTVLETLAYDFSTGVDIRIAANEGMLWIALDGIRVFKIEDAYNENGKIQFSHTTALNERGAVITDLALLRYKEKTANQGISDPVKSDIILSGDDIAAVLKGQGWTNIEGGTAATPESAWNKEYDGWGCKIYKAQNFIYDFTLKFAGDEDGAMELRLRHDTTKVCNLGYRLYFTKDTLTIGKYHDNDFQNDQIAKVISDFTKGVKVRIAANEGKLWIAFDGIRVFSIDDAYNADGYIQISHTKGVPEGNITLTDMLLREYSDEKANEGVTDKNTGDSDILMTSNEILTAMTNTTWKRKDANSVVNLMSDGKGTQVGAVKDFILDFTLRISPAETGNLQVRVRHDYNKVSNLGYVMLFSSNGVSLNKYNTNNYQSTKVDSRQLDFTQSKRVRIVANGGIIWVSVNGEKIFEIKNAYNEKEKVIVQNSFANANTVTFSDPCLYKYSDKRAGETVTAPPADSTVFPVTDMVSLDKILALFEKNGHKITNNSVINQKAGSGKGVNLCGTRDFILIFKLKMAAGQAGGVTVKFRHYYENANYGYLLNLDRKSASFTRYLEKKGGDAITYGSEKIDFTKGVNVRIVASEGLVWIAFDGVKKFELTDAALYTGQIQFLVSGDDAVVELSDFSLTSYGEEESYAGMTNRKLQLTTPKHIRDYEIGNQSDADKLFYGRFDYEEYEGKPAIKFSSEGQGRENVIYGQKLDNFILSFNINMDSCSSVNFLQMNFRKTYDSTRNYGFVVHITQGLVQLLNYSETSFSLGSIVGKSSLKMKGWVPIKVVAKDETVAVLINDVLVMKGNVKDIEGGIISFQNNLSGTNNIYFADIMLTEYYDGALPDGEVISVSTPTNIARKTYKDPVKVVAEYKKVNQITQESKFPLVPVIAIGSSVIVLAAVSVAVVLVIKKRKKA